jgi:hypothetical protein
MGYLATGLDGAWSLEPILLTPNLNRDGIVNFIDFSLHAHRKGNELTGATNSELTGLQQFSEYWLSTQ